VVAASVLKEIRDGKTPSRADALRLVEARGDEFEELLETAAALRDRHKSKTVTFSPKVFIPLTNLCRDFCGYCTFRKAPDEIGAKTMSIDEVLAVARRGKLLGCTEALFSLGDKPEAIYPEMKAFLARLGLKRTLDYLYDAAKRRWSRPEFCRTPIPASWEAAI
jgi:FO synthase